MTIPAIETEYAGHLFRSRLEARWAAMFDYLHWPWSYEPTDFDGYIPDFRLDFAKLPGYVEVRGDVEARGDPIDRAYRAGVRTPFLVVSGLNSQDNSIGWLQHLEYKDPDFSMSSAPRVPLSMCFHCGLPVPWRRNDGPRWFCPVCDEHMPGEMRGWFLSNSREDLGGLSLTVGTALIRDLWGFAHQDTRWTPKAAPDRPRLVGGWDGFK